jgi:RNA polymerase sigma-B factor
VHVATTPTRDQERRLFVRYVDGGDTTARDQLVEQCLPLARSLARRYANRGESMEDLMQVASIGLIKAVDRFDPARGIAFSSFAVPSILGEIKRHFRDHGWAARVPRALQERVLEIDSATAQLTAELRRSPTAREVAAATDQPVEEVIEAMVAGAAHSSVSLDAPLTSEEDSAGTYADTVGEVDGRFELIEYRSVLDSTMAALPERERQILALRFIGGLTQSQIAERIGISQMHVSRLIRRALARLSTVAAA